MTSRLFALVGVVLLVLVAVPATAAPSLPVPRAAVQLVLDAGGSMVGVRAAGLRAALRAGVDELAGDVRVGARVFGGRCDGTSVRAPVAALDRRRIGGAYDGVTPGGETPTGLAVEQAQRDLPNGATRTIVLVTGGPASCEGNPCAARLDGRTRIEVIGYGGGRELACLAQRTGGRFRPAADAVALRIELARALVRAVRQPTDGGALLVGAPSFAAAPALPAGRWVDMLRPGVAKHWTLTVPARTRPIVSVTLARPYGWPAARDELSVDLLRPDGTKCTGDQGGRDQDNGVAPLTVTLRPSSCGAGQFVLRLFRPAGGPELPVEMFVLLEPPVSSAGPAAVVTESTVDLPAFSSVPAGSAPGGGSSGDAGLVRNGLFTADIRAGETLYWRVSVGWGQRLHYAVQLAPVGRSTVAPVSTWVVNPAGEFVEPLRPDPSFGTYDADGAPFVVRNETVPVAYRNRERASVAPVSLAGSYVIAVQMDADAGLAGTPVPVSLAVRAPGRPSGAPSYAAVSGATSPSALLAGPVPASSPARGPSVPLLAGGVAALLVAAALLLAPVLRRRSARPSRSGPPPDR